MTLTEAKNNPQGLTGATLAAAGTRTSRDPHGQDGQQQHGALSFVRAGPCLSVSVRAAYFSGVSPQAQAVPRRKSAPTSGGA